MMRFQANPNIIEKYLYIDKTPTWKVRSLYLFGIVSWLLIVFEYLWVAKLDTFFSYFFVPIVIFLTVYHLGSFGLYLFYKQFDKAIHIKKVQTLKKSDWRPQVDIFLPICGEDFSVLKNTWKHIAELDYPNKKVYVLDDSEKDTALHQKLAESFGFAYFERPNKGEMKKAGNLKYGFERSNGEFFAIFDADFAPHKDFILEVLPYMQDFSVGIVQTPQYFEVTEKSYKSSKIAYNAAFAEEPFYRFIQTARNRFGAAICCGSNALYRRDAIQAIGGPYQIENSEDAHTGFEITKSGFSVLFLPVILAIGSCPDNHYSFFHQQHRWCLGSMRLMLSKKFWTAPIPLVTKFCYISGFLFYIHHPIIILFSFHLLWVLLFYNELIPTSIDLLYLPHLLFAVIYIGFFMIAKFKIGYFLILLARSYAYSHAVLTAIKKGSVNWISTNASHSSLSRAFKQTIIVVVLYTLAYSGLALISIKTGNFHLFDVRYWSMQIWIVVNLILTVVLLVSLLSVAISISRGKNQDFELRKLA